MNISYRLAGPSRPMVYLTLGLCFAAVLCAQPVANLPLPQSAAQPANVTIDAKSPAARLIPDVPIAPPPSQDFVLQLNWNDAQIQGRVALQNPSDQPMDIDGVQCSGNIFLTAIPQSVPAHGSVDLPFIFDAKSGTNSDSDVIRLKTSQGEKLVQITHARQKVVALDRQELDWNIGETGPKSVRLQITGSVTRLTKVLPMAGATATFNDLGGGSFSVTVTPRSTAAPASFPVILTFDPALPGSTPVITCVVGAKS